MKRSLTVLLIVALMVVGMAIPAFAAGKSDIAQIHPGHMGAVNSGDYHGVPTIHFHFVGPYEKWGEAVSWAASTFKGIPNAHGG